MTMMEEADEGKNNCKIYGEICNLFICFVLNEAKQ